MSSIIKKITGVAFGIAMTGFIASSANAIVIYDNFDPATPDGFDASTGWTVDSIFTVGMQFMAASTGVVTSVDVGMGVIGQPPKSVSFTLFADDGSNNLGALLDTFTISVGNSFGTLGTSSGTPNAVDVLNAGSFYWLVATSVDGTNIPWNLNTTGDVGNVWSNGSVFPNETLGTFRINGDPVAIPEPVSLALFGLGLAGLGFSRRKQA